MDNADLIWVESRKGAYQFFLDCLTHAPNLYYLLALIEQEMYLDFKRVQLYCPSSEEFENALLAWKNETRIRRKVNEDYFQLLDCDPFKKLCKLLSDMFELLTQEDLARKMKRRGESIRQSLNAQILLIEENLLPVQQSLSHEIQNLCNTLFYRMLIRVVMEFMLSDYQKLSRTLMVVDTLGI